MESTNKTKVVFRRWNDTNEVIAIFPNTEGKRGFVQSYEHNGQHSFCGVELIDKLKKATPNEYNALKNEFVSLGYNLDVIE